VTRPFSPARIAGALAGLIGAALIVAYLVLYLVPSNDYVLLPDTAHPVAPLVRVQGGHEPKGPGAIYFVDVFERRAGPDPGEELLEQGRAPPIFGR
jgi:hypothetical protein